MLASQKIRTCGPCTSMIMGMNVKVPVTVIAGKRFVFCPNAVGTVQVPLSPRNLVITCMLGLILQNISRVQVVQLVGWQVIGTFRGCMSSVYLQTMRQGEKSAKLLKFPLQVPTIMTTVPFLTRK